MDGNPDCGLIVFLRFPEKGKVKTRIASSLGEDAALAIYKELTDITLGLVSDLNAQVYLFYEGGMPEKSQRNPSFQYLDQAHGNLGDKMLDAFDVVLQKHAKVIIIGSDCPQLSTPDIHEGFLMLDAYDVVIGPGEDGGYYLLGCREIIHNMFKDIAWSTSSVLEKTIRIIEGYGKKYFLLRTLNDIDEEKDWASFKKAQLL